MSSVLEEALPMLMTQRGAPAQPVELPGFRCGVPRVDVADRTVIVDVLGNDVGSS
jgi:hypothetical protein